MCAGLSAWAACLVVFVLILNYATTGLPIDQPITRFWHWANVEKLYELGSLPMALNLYLGTKGLIAEQFPLFSRNSYKLVVQSLRLDLLYPLVGWPPSPLSPRFKAGKARERRRIGKQPRHTRSSLAPRACWSAS